MKHIVRVITRCNRIIPVLFVAGLGAIASAQFAERVTVIHEWAGEHPNDRFGRVNRAIGDIDGDGVGDVAIASPHNTDGGVEAGKVYIYSGATGFLIRKHLGEEQWNLGNELATVGDVDGDDVQDYIIGAPSGLSGDPVGPGRAFLFSGADGACIASWEGEGDKDRFGRIVAGAGTEMNGGIGDIDGDDIPDFLIGAPNHDSAGVDAGRAYVFSGANPAKPIMTIDGEAAGDQLGLGLGGLGDLDGDGCGDFVVGAPQNVGPGRAYVISGATGEYLFDPLVGDATGVSFGVLFSSGPGDVNRDGTNDIFVTDIANTANGASTGRAYVFSGVDGSPIHTWTGIQSGEGLGVGRGCGDVNFDGHPDLLVCAFSSSVGATNGGRAFVYSGRDGSLLRTMTNITPFDFFGWSAVGAEDVNGDGAIDFLISAALSNAHGVATGRAFLIAGDIFPPTGDLNGDGDVDGTDLLQLLGAWGPCDDCNDCPADFDHDCAVAGSDLIFLLGNWG